MQLGDRLSKNKERGGKTMNKGVYVGQGLRKIKHMRGNIEGVGA